jgi:hypothetical protein
MSDTYIPRSLEPVIRKAASEFPALVLVGPHQSGKTTLLNHIFGDSHRIISLESPDVRLLALNDPRGFLNLFPPPVVFDEIQYTPDLLPYIKEMIDRSCSQTGQYILTGSQNLLLMQQMTKSLAGRAAILKLMPLTHWEIDGVPGHKLHWERSTQVLTSNTPFPDQPPAFQWEKALRGYYPEICLSFERDARLWNASYVQTYLDRDVRNLRNIGDLYPPFPKIFGKGG